MLNASVVLTCCTFSQFSFSNSRIPMGLILLSVVYSPITTNGYGEKAVTSLLSLVVSLWRDLGVCYLDLGSVKFFRTQALPRWAKRIVYVSSVLFWIRGFASFPQGHPECDHPWNDNGLELWIQRFGLCACVSNISAFSFQPDTSFGNTGTLELWYYRPL